MFFCFTFAKIVPIGFIVMLIVKDTVQLGMLLRQTRRRQNLTQMQLAAACGVGVRFLRELEGGKQSCHLAKTLHVIRMLGLRVEVG